MAAAGQASMSDWQAALAAIQNKIIIKTVLITHLPGFRNQARVENDSDGRTNDEFAPSPQSVPIRQQAFCRSQALPVMAETTYP